MLVTTSQATAPSFSAGAEMRLAVAGFHGLAITQRGSNEPQRDSYQLSHRFALLANYQHRLETSPSKAKLFGAVRQPMKAGRKIAYGFPVMDAMVYLF